MFNTMKAGSVAALFLALVYLAGFALMASLAGHSAGLGPEQQLAAALERKTLVWLLNGALYIVSGLALLVLTTATDELLKPGARDWMRLATPLGYIWAGVLLAAGMIAQVGLESVARLHAKDPAQALQLWRALNLMLEGLGGGVEILGGCWVLLLARASLGQSLMPKSLLVLSILVGLAGVLTAVPALADAVYVFGLGQIPWFMLLAYLLWRRAAAA